MRAILIGLLYAAMALPLHRRLGGQGAMLLTAVAQMGPAVLIGMAMRTTRAGCGLYAAACAGMTLVWTAIAGVLPSPRQAGFGAGLAALAGALPFLLFLFALALGAGAFLAGLLRRRS